MDIDEAVEIYSEKYSVPGGLIKAIIQAESASNQYAVRYEPHYRWTVEPFDKFHWSEKTEEISQKTSWGLMQIMGAVARERGFEGRYLAELCTVKVGIKYGTKHLKWQYDRYGDWHDAISAYNQGSNRKTNGEYNNQEYVDKVLKFWEG